MLARMNSQADQRPEDVAGALRHRARTQRSCFAPPLWPAFAPGLVRSDETLWHPQLAAVSCTEVERESNGGRVPACDMADEAFQALNVASGLQHGQKSGTRPAHFTLFQSLSKQKRKPCGKFLHGLLEPCSQGTYIGVRVV